MILALALAAPLTMSLAAGDTPPNMRPNIVLLMSDDQGWGETGYNGHPHVKTPVLDDMAGTGLRLDRFYAASASCTPTRASVLTGRHANRSGAFAPNWATRPEEITFAHILSDAGYRTAHFGKWHVGPVKADSPLNPRRMGFDEYVSHDNFFEMDPPLSRNGAPPEIHPGEGSAVVVEEALHFARRALAEGRPFLAVVHFGSPHEPYSAPPEDLAQYAHLPAPTSHRFAEISTMDRAIGTLRRELERMGVREDTLVWFKSDNGITWEGIPTDQHGLLYNGGFRGRKNSLYEGGLVVPAIIEWPAVIRAPRVSSVPVVTSDILPTILDLLGLRHPAPERPLDGISIKSLILDGTLTHRPSPIGFWRFPTATLTGNPSWLPEDLMRGTTPTFRNPGIQFQNRRHLVARSTNFGGTAAWTDNRYKLVVDTPDGGGSRPVTEELYDLLTDPNETRDLAGFHPEIVQRMRGELDAWQRSVDRSLTGADYR